VRVAVTGTPGTGKTAATQRLDTSLEVIHLNDVVTAEGFTTGRDEDRDSLIVDLEAVQSWLAGRTDVLFESHLAHEFPADRVVVLRCHPEELERRLRERGEPATKAGENAESEALDVILAEAVERHGEDGVYEIDTTDRSPAAVAEEISRVVTDDRGPSAGEVSYIEYL